MSNKKLVSIIALIGLGALIVYLISPVLAPFAVGALIAFVLQPLERFFEKKLKIKKWLSIILVFIVVILGITLFVFSVGSPLMKEIETLISKLSKYNYSNLINDLKTILVNINAPQFIMEKVNNFFESDWTQAAFQYVTEFFMSQLEPIVSVVGSSVVSYIGKSISIILDIVLSIVVVIYLLADSEKIKETILRAVPTEKVQKRARVIFDEGVHLFRNYLKVQVIIAIIISSVLGIIYAICGVKYTLLLMAITFILNFIPFFGSIISGVIAIFVSLITGGIQQAIIITIAIIICQQLEGNILTPKLQSQSNGVHPIVVLIAILACNYLWGAIGMFIAVPLIGVIKLIFKHGIEMIKEMD